LNSFTPVLLLGSTDGHQALSRLGDAWVGVEAQMIACRSLAMGLASICSIT
jgi:hypothetical protein